MASPLLEDLGELVAASAGAACHTGGHQTISAVLQAMDVPEEYALGTMRLSVGRHTTDADVAKAADLIVAAVREQLKQPRVVGPDGLPWWC